MADQFRTISGIVQFPPRDGNANGKAVRNITVRQTGFKEQGVRVNATLWPSHEHVAVEEGDVVMLDGKYSANQTTKDDGSPVTYHNLSVTRIAVLGKSDSGKKVDVENADADDNGDDDIPF